MALNITQPDISPSECLSGFSPTGEDVTILLQISLHWPVFPSQFGNNITWDPHIIAKYDTKKSKKPKTSFISKLLPRGYDQAEESL